MHTLIFDNRFYIGGAGISQINIIDALNIVDNRNIKKCYGYICFMNTRTAYLANHNKSYCDIQNKSIITFADGMPLIWLAKIQGNQSFHKCSGKDFMDSIFSLSVKKNYSHYFYGSTVDSIIKIENNIKNKYPGILIYKAISPPFQKVDDFDIDSLAVELNDLKPTFFWCGLGAPKQEILISKLQRKLESTFCVGVGLAFEYIAGTVDRAPLWMQKYGLEWLFRLSQQPRNIPRAIKPFLWVIKMLIFYSKKRK
jgi:N-acetylglucosaminyldiphosphoundecaprenol N-acetyl-beta-D-mannosaminyltransferase